VYRSIHRPLTVCGVDRRLFFLALMVGAAAFNLFYSFLAGCLLFAAVYAFAVGVLLVPSLTRSIFSGSSGESAASLGMLGF
jgi:hypothetical protein